MSAICPHCGCDTEQAVYASFGPLTFYPRTGAFAAGVRLDMSPQCHDMLGALMLAPACVFSSRELADIAGTNASDRDGLISVLICTIRKALRAEGISGAVKNVSGKGYYFDPSAVSTPPHDSAPPAQSFEPRPGLPPLTGAGSLGEGL